MVKKRVGGAHRYSKAVQAATKAAQAADGPKPPQHLQRKITRKVKFIEKVQKSSTAAAAALQVKGNVKKKRSKAKKPLPDLKALAGELELLAAAQTQQQQQGTKPPQASVKHQKQRLRTGVAESQRLQRVLQDPAFKADPFQAITNHLMHTMPAAPQPPKQQQQQQQQGKKKKKKSKSGSGGGADAMQS